MEIQDTIAAPATVPAPAAIGVIRLSGPEAERVAGRVFRPFNGKPLESVAERFLVNGVLLDGDSVLDRCMACVMREPRSYTGETAVELYTHGSPAVTVRALTLLYAAGARPALPGEFTRRAVLNGKLDLIQAEAVADLIHAETPAAARNAAAQLGGAVSRRLEQAWALLTGVLARVSACVDYPEDDVTELTAAEIDHGLSQASALLAALADTYRRGMILRDGANLVVAGRPNTGKSSLFNALLGYDRAIVTPVPGTTRDAVEARVTLNGVLFNLIDTAGVHDAADAVEAEGVRRSGLMLESADASLVVLDASREADEYDNQVLTMTKNIPRVVVLNKCDLRAGAYPGALEALETLEEAEDLEEPPVLPVSALTGEGLDKLTQALAALVTGTDGPCQGGEVLLTNARHANAVREARDAVEECRAAIKSNVPADAALCVLESALDVLAELTGKKASEDVLEQVFSRFCIGK